MVEDATAYANGTEKLYWKEEVALADSPIYKPYRVDVAIPELIIGIFADDPREKEYADPEVAQQWFAAIENSLNRAFPPDAGSSTVRSLPSVLPDSDYWTVTDLGREVSIGSPIVGSPGTTHSVHYNVGVPLCGVRDVLQSLKDHPRRDISRDNRERQQAMAFMGQALEFGDRVAAMYAFNKHVGGNIPPGFEREIPWFSAIPDKDVQEVRGAASMLYSVAALATHGATYTSDLTKRYISALPRQNPDVILRELSPQAQNWLKALAPAIANEFQRTYETAHPTQVEDYATAQGAWRGVTEPLGTRLELNAARTARDLVMSGLDKDYSRRAGIEDVVTSTRFDNLDKRGPIPLVVLEARQYGENSISANEFEVNSAHLRQQVAAAHEKYDSLADANPARQARVEEYKRQLVIAVTAAAAARTAGPVQQQGQYQQQGASNQQRQYQQQGAGQLPPRAYR
ncbi:hypothetical protein ACIPPJ_35640 [Streptomyces sp. NPDC086091]|uniref:hypothetical protein n=1 Tax=Streptomyces sp. NPDC086091 TaxID=3365751 RepID=UPI0038164CBB